MKANETPGNVERVVVSFSGGLDSTTLLCWALRRYEVNALTFHYGSKHARQEIKAAESITAKFGVAHKIIHLPFINELFNSDLLASGGTIPEGHYEDNSMRRTVVPFRNGIMLSIAVGYAESIGATTVLYAAHSGDHAIYPDCRPEFLNAMSEAGRLGTYAGLEIKDPFIGMSKGDIVTLGTDLQVPFGSTYSCYNGRPKHCGKCGACVERKEAFELAGIDDPTVYEG